MTQKVAVPATDDTTWIEPIALRCADSFRAVAESFIHGTLTNLPKGSVEAYGPRLGDIAACATNLAFALEIYLKCLRIQVGLPPRAEGKGHDLWELYKELPSQVRTAIEERYESGRTRPFPTHASFTYVLQRSPVPPIWDEGNEKSMALPDVLKRSKDTFVSWRYVFEIQQPNRHDLVRRRTFEYLLLLFACTAINAVILRTWFTPRLATASDAARPWLLLSEEDFATVSQEQPWQIADVTDRYTGKRYRIRNIATSNGIDAVAEEL